MNKICIGEYILKYRKEHNLSQGEFGKLLGVSAFAVSKWERGYAYPDLPLLVPIAELFSVSIDELFGYEKKEIKK